MVSQKPGRPRDQQSDQWQQDLNPNSMTGQNHGVETNQEGNDDLTVYDLPELRDRLSNFTNKELQKILVLKPGTCLQQGATYINLNDPLRQEFRGMRDMSAEDSNFVVPKRNVGYQLWNRLIEVENTERTGE